MHRHNLQSGQLQAISYAANIAYQSFISAIKDYNSFLRADGIELRLEAIGKAQLMAETAEEHYHTVEKLLSRVVGLGFLDEKRATKRVDSYEGLILQYAIGSASVRKLKSLMFSKDRTKLISESKPYKKDPQDLLEMVSHRKKSYNDIQDEAIEASRALRFDVVKAMLDHAREQYKLSTTSNATNPVSRQKSRS